MTMPVSAAQKAARQASHDARLAAARQTVPHGLYCYRPLGLAERTLQDGTKVPAMRIEKCPFWKRRGDWPRQANGYCRLLKCGDNSKNRRSTLLLWDQVKECGINLPTDEELELGVLAELAAADLPPQPA
jgi:hypothetical protein